MLILNIHVSFKSVVPNFFSITDWFHVRMYIHKHNIGVWVMGRSKGVGGLLEAVSPWGGAQCVEICLLAGTDPVNLKIKHFSKENICPNDTDNYIFILALWPSIKHHREPVWSPVVGDLWFKQTWSTKSGQKRAWAMFSLLQFLLERKSFFSASLYSNICHIYFFLAFFQMWTFSVFRSKYAL